MSVQQRARLRQQEEVTGAELAGGGTLQWLVDAELGAQHVMSFRLTLPGDSSESHAHDGAEEALYVLEGAGEIRVEGTSHPVAPGQAVFIPEGAEHTYVNPGKTPIVILGAMAPPIHLANIRPAMPRLDLSSVTRSAISERALQPTMMDEERITPTMMGERSFRVLISPQIGCRRMTQFTGVIPTGRAPLHAHPHEEAVYILAGNGRLWIESDAVGDLHAGSIIFFPIGVRHSLENIGEEELKVLGAFSPAGSPEAKLGPT